MLKKCIRDKHDNNHKTWKYNNKNVHKLRVHSTFNFKFRGGGYHRARNNIHPPLPRSLVATFCVWGVCVDVSWCALRVHTRLDPATPTQNKVFVWPFLCINTIIPDASKLLSSPLLCPYLKKKFFSAVLCTLHFLNIIYGEFLPWKRKSCS